MHTRCTTENPGHWARCRDTKWPVRAVLPTCAQGHEQPVPRLSTGQSTTVESRVAPRVDAAGCTPITSVVNEAPDRWEQLAGEGEKLQASGGFALCTAFANASDEPQMRAIGMGTFARS